jgi:hypothetical protein
MDWALARQARIEAALARHELEPGGFVLYDLSSSYLHGSKCPLGAFRLLPGPPRPVMAIGSATGAWNARNRYEHLRDRAGPNSLGVGAHLLREGMVTDTRMRADAGPLARTTQRTRGGWPSPPRVRESTSRIDLVMRIPLLRASTHHGSDTWIDIRLAYAESLLRARGWTPIRECAPKPVRPGSTEPTRGGCPPPPNERPRCHPQPRDSRIDFRQSALIMRSPLLCARVVSDARMRADATSSSIWGPAPDRERKRERARGSSRR